MTGGSVAVVGSGFAGSLLARILAVQGHDVVLLERGTHPRFAIGESTTPLANLSLERLAKRYGLDDCHDLAAHGRWLRRFPELRRGLKRGFTFYRHHEGQPLAECGGQWERLLVGASPTAEVADSHWLRADVDHHFAQRAVAAGVDYRDRVELEGAALSDSGALLRGRREGRAFELKTDFVVDASGPGGFLARQLAIPSGLERARTNSALVFSHFTGVRLMTDVVDMPAGPYPDDWAAVHHIVDGGWMYSLRFDDGVTSAGFALSPRALAATGPGADTDAAALWHALVERYPTIHDAFQDATPIMPIAHRARIQHRLTRATGPRWAMLPHAYSFTDPLFSTGIAWGLRSVERLALAFEGATAPSAVDLARYESLLAAEADQIDALVAGAYHAMMHFDLFAAQAMIYFATVSYAEAHQRLFQSGSEVAWNGFLGVGDPVQERLPAESYRRLGRLTGDGQRAGTPEGRQAFVDWVAASIAPRNVAGLAEPARRHLYPVDLDALVERHELLGLSREELIAALPRLRGFSP